LVLRRTNSKTQLAADIKNAKIEITNVAILMRNHLNFNVLATTPRAALKRRPHHLKKSTTIKQPALLN
jgi:hypothetical protein